MGKAPAGVARPRREVHASIVKEPSTGAHRLFRRLAAPFRRRWENGLASRRLKAGRGDFRRPAFHSHETRKAPRRPASFRGRWKTFRSAPRASTSPGRSPPPAGKPDRPCGSSPRSWKTPRAASSFPEMPQGSPKPRESSSSSSRKNMEAAEAPSMLESPAACRKALQVAGDFRGLPEISARPGKSPRGGVPGFLKTETSTSRRGARPPRSGAFLKSRAPPSRRAGRAPCNSEWEG